MYVQAPTVLAGTAGECSLAFWLRASRPCKIYIYIYIYHLPSRAVTIEWYACPDLMLPVGAKVSEAGERRLAAASTGVPVGWNVGSLPKPPACRP